MNISELIERTRKGEDDNKSEIIEYLHKFPLIILRGAGQFGTALGEYLLNIGIIKEKLIYWDVRATTIRKVNGILVALPFSTEFDRTLTLTINCIPNGSLSGSAGGDEFFTAGYENYIPGMALFEALICRMNPAQGFDATICTTTNSCNWSACKRLSNILYNTLEPEKSSRTENKLVFPIATFVINQKCTLACTHCGQYINHYNDNERINFPLSRITEDIDKTLQAVDAIGYISVIGGEPFLHPNLVEIIQHIMTKKNFGVIGITTNGICKIEESQLEVLKNGKTRIIISDYTPELNKKQKQIFLDNVDKISKSGISFSIGKPVWSTPTSLRKFSFDAKTKTEMKSKCNSTVTCKTIQNGFYYPCSATAGIGSHKLESYDSDWVDISSTNLINELRNKIKSVDNKNFYDCCNHCGDGGVPLEKSGEQGIDLSYLHIGKANKVNI